LSIDKIQQLAPVIADRVFSGVEEIGQILFEGRISLLLIFMKAVFPIPGQPRIFPTTACISQIFFSAAAKQSRPSELLCEDTA
jgi:hypothetical protein